MAPASSDQTLATRLLKAFSGGMLFGIPLLYTMEVFEIGTHTTPPQLAAVLGITFVVIFGLQTTGGFQQRRSAPLRVVFLDAMEALAMGLVSAFAVLVLLQRLRPGSPLTSAIGMTLYEGAPFAMGVSLSRLLLSGDRNGGGSDDDGGDADKGSLHQTLADLGATAVGALFVSFSIAPTEEVRLLAASLHSLHLLALIPATLAVTYVIVFAAGFTDSAGRHGHEGPLQSPLSETGAAYLISVGVALGLLILFQRADLTQPFSDSMRQALVLGFPAAVGGAAGRLAV